MRKLVTNQSSPVGPDENLITPESISEVEVSSEVPERQIEAAFSPDGGAGWRAGDTGEQRIRIVFERPEHVRRIGLKFVENDRQRTQEFVLSWSADVNTPTRDIVRQQWTFSPGGSTTECENYRVELDNVRVLELMIRPDLNDQTAVASLAEWRIYRK